MDFWVEKYYVNSKEKLNVTLEHSSDSTDLSDQKLKWKNLIHSVFLDENGVYNLIRTEKYGPLSGEKFKSEVEGYLRTSQQIWMIENSNERAQFTECV